MGLSKQNTNTFSIGKLLSTSNEHSNIDTTLKTQTGRTSEVKSEVSINSESNFCDDNS